MSRYYEMDIRGKHWLHRVDDIATYTHGGPDDEGRLVYSKSNQKLYLGTTTDWKLVTGIYDVFPSSSKVLLGVYPLPTGWNLDTTYNDIAVLVGDQESDVDTTGGSWTITGIQPAGDHDHGGRTGKATNSIVFGKSEPYARTNTNAHTHSISTDGDHQHIFGDTWRFPTLNYCIAVYSP